MKAQEMRDLPTEELKQKHEELLSEYFGLRLKHALGQLENPLVLRNVRRDIARAKTLLSEKGVPETIRRRRRTGAWVAAKDEAKAKGKDKEGKGKEGKAKEPRAARKKRGSAAAEGQD